MRQNLLVEFPFLFSGDGASPDKGRVRTSGRLLGRLLGAVAATAVTWSPAASSAAGHVLLKVAPSATLPFSSSALGDAIAARLSATEGTAGPLQISIEQLTTTPSKLRIGAGDRVCDVDLDPAQSAPDAMRTVALLTADLIESSSPQASVGSAPLWGGGADLVGVVGGPWGDSRFEAALTMKRRIASRLWATFGAGFGRMTRSGTSAAETAGNEIFVSIGSLPVKAGLAADFAWGELRAAAGARFYRADSTSGTLYGGWLELRPDLLRTGLGKLSAVAAVELMSQRLEVRPVQQTGAVFTSGYVTPWLGLSASLP